MATPKNPIKSGHLISAKKEGALLAKSVEGRPSHVEAGKTYTVEEVLDQTNAHDEELWVNVRLGYGCGDWWIKAEQWKIIHKGGKVNDQKDDYVLPIYFSQVDNERDPLRTCFSSTAATILKYYKPDSIEDDNEYLKEVFKFGDTTDASVQLKALREYGIQAEFSQTKTTEWLIDKVCGGDVVGIGWLHRGTAENPSGHGHWSVCWGWDRVTQSFKVHDPYHSRFNHQTGQYESTEQGYNQRFGFDMMTDRWTVEGPNSGWALYVL